MRSLGCLGNNLGNVPGQLKDLGNLLIVLDKILGGIYGNSIVIGATGNYLGISDVYLRPNNGWSLIFVGGNTIKSSINYYSLNIDIEPFNFYNILDDID